MSVSAVPELTDMQCPYFLPLGRRIRFNERGKAVHPALEKRFAFVAERPVVFYQTIRPLNVCFGLHERWHVQKR